MVNYVNSTMDEIHEISDELYEALIDEEHNIVDDICLKFLQVIRDVKKSNYEYIRVSK